MWANFHRVNQNLLLIVLVGAFAWWGRTFSFSWPPFPPLRSRAAHREPAPCTANYGILDATDDLVDLDENDGCNFLKGEIPFFDNHCVKLLEQGPCAPGEWLVIDDDDDQVICEEKECPDGQVMYDDHCIPLNSNPCKRSFDLIINECGEGECECPPGSLFHKDTDMCYVAYSQGPCKPGYIIKMEVDEKGGYGECMRNPCPREKMAPMDKYCTPRESTRKAKCYNIGSQAPCRDGSYLLIEPSLTEPFCLNKMPNSIVPKIVKRSTACQMSYRSSCYRGCRQRSYPFRGSCGDDYVYMPNYGRPLCVKMKCERTWRR